ncbi:MAG: [FeFe] hydrogenase H-cluster radical SAM maturase HydG [Candidatus Omnitrophica bacterium]|nr:[FeFe] hydrogenase H-cluster radical SAM maturase HydG [Candidatus Omnitrophota bacterium]
MSKMKYIDEEIIFGLLDQARNAGSSKVRAILDKAKSLKRLSLSETAVLLAAQDKKILGEIFQAASFVKDTIYGRRIVLFAPLYISNLCSNNCLYCAFKSDNALTKRKALNTEEIKSQVKWLLERGHKRILLVSGEAPGVNSVDYYCDAVKAIYSVSVGPHRIKRVNVNCAPLSIEEFKKLKSAGIGTYQLFQETYHDKTYREAHPKGPKSDPDNRIDAIGRAFRAGIDDIGIGVLYGLYDWQFETLAMLSHVEHLEKEFNVGPHTISVPRIEEAAGVEFTKNLPYKVRDDDFKKIVAVLRLSVPYTGMILSTRETPQMRDELFSLGISQVSAESRTSPGGYSSEDNNRNNDIQFTLGDQRTLEEVIGSLIGQEFIPSFCAACYRKERTGEAFMNLARPGTIKGKCNINALITLKEYLDDFASESTKIKGYQLIRHASSGLDDESRKQLERFFNDIDKGIRDEFV